jgi:DNA-binding NarL/FixJ family response regulator
MQIQPVDGDISREKSRLIGVAIRENSMRFGPDIRPAALLDRADKARLRIVLVEDHAILRDGVKVLIEMESDFEVVGDFCRVQEGLDGISRLRPDLVITDLALPGRSGIELLAEIRRLLPETRKLVLTAHENEEYVRAALNAGADGYVLKEANSSELMLAIRTVSAGEQFLCKAIATKVLSGYLSGDQRPSGAAVAQSITGREREVLTRIALGNSNKLIARDLGLSPKTVEKHRSNLMRKLQLHNAAAITTYAIRHGMTGGDLIGGPLAGRLLALQPAASID